MRGTRQIFVLVLLFCCACPSREDADKTSKTVATQEANETIGIGAEEIRIGTWGPLSGPAAAWSSVIHGMEAYFAYLNERGGIHGRRLHLVYRDDQYDPSKTPSVVRELVEVDRVFAIVSGVGTANGRAVADYLEEKGVPFFTPSSGDEFWTNPGKSNVWTVFPPYIKEGEILGEYLASTMKRRRVAVLRQDDEFGKQGARGIAAGLARHGLKIVAEVSCLPTDLDLSGQASRLLASTPDTLVIYAAPKQAVLLVKLLHAQNQRPQIVTSFVLSDPLLLELGGALWEGAITSATTKLADSDDPAVELYRSVLTKYGKPNLRPGYFTMSGFSFAMPFVEALDRAGRNVSRSKLREALDSFDHWESAGPHWPGKYLGAPVTFRDRRLGVDGIFLARAQNGRWVPLTDWLTN